MCAGTAIALLFSAANVFFRDFSNVVSILTNLRHASAVPMIYPYALVEERFGSFAEFYLLNPLANAVLLLQRGFWVGTTERPGGDGRDRLARQPLHPGPDLSRLLSDLPGHRTAGVLPPGEQDRGAPVTTMTESIVAQNVSKQFTLRYHRTLKQMTFAAMRRQEISDTFLALDDVSFTVQQGESIGLMGLNGSGKSTLLKLINGIMRPDSGSIRTRGRIAGLIATGAGFHAQLTGRDNIFLNAAILGMSEAETRRKFDDIVEFADVGKHLDSPVGHYSSGMYSRLGFAVAIHVDTDIFLADEVLAVGDKPFKRKCIAADAGGPRQRSHPLLRQPLRPARCARCATGSSCWRRAGLGFDGEVDAGIKYLKYDSDDAHRRGERGRRARRRHLTRTVRRLVWTRRPRPERLPRSA